jgi:uracil-DNA glycosylase family 4
MEQKGQFNASLIVQSLNGWWKLAGVDSAVDELPVNWLEVGARHESAANPQPQTQTTHVIPKAAPSEPAIEWPKDIESLRQMVSSGAPLPGNSFGPRCMPSIGPSHPDVMIVSDVPDPDDLDSGSLSKGSSGQLLRRMMHAIGVDLDTCYWSTLATTRPSTGEIPETEFAGLAKFMLHQLELVSPKSIILLGSTASYALLGEELMKARQNLGNINHGGITLPVLTTFHPRTLIARPALKAQAWRDLQMFAKRSQV